MDDGPAELQGWGSDVAEMPLIGVLSGAEARAVQECLARFAIARMEDCRVAGVVEVFEADCASGGGKASGLRAMPGGEEFALFQELGSAAQSCALLPEGLIAAGETVRARIAAGCDLVVLSKFGKLEAESGSGLVPAFAEALAAGVPILTSVSPSHAAAWERFAAPFFIRLPVGIDAVEEWWNAVRSR